CCCSGEGDRGSSAREAPATNRAEQLRSDRRYERPPMNRASLMARSPASQDRTAPLALSSFVSQSGPGCKGKFPVLASSLLLENDSARPASRLKAPERRLTDPSKTRIGCNRWS